MLNPTLWLVYFGNMLQYVLMYILLKLMNLKKKICKSVKEYFQLCYLYMHKIQIRKIGMK